MTTIDPIWNLPPTTEHMTMLANDPLAQQLPWHIVDNGIDRLLWPLVKDVTKKKKILLVDTGVSKTHCDEGELAGQVIEVADFTNSGRSGPWDHKGHGSHVAGIMLSKRFGIGKDCLQLYSAKALGDNGVGYDSAIAAAIAWGLKRPGGIDAINLSLGSNQLSKDVDGILREATQQGVLIFCAAGNDGGPVGEPGAQPYAITASATNQQRLIANFSNRGPQVTICAPGVEIFSLAPQLSYATMSGTSMSCPNVCAYACCKLAYDELHSLPPIKTWQQAYEWMTDDADDLGVPGRDPLYGLGILNPAKFKKAAPLPIAPLPIETAPDTILVEGLKVGSALYRGTLQKLRQ